MTLKTLIADNAATALCLGGVLVGIVYGAIAQRTGFCTLGAISDWALFGDKRRARSWLLAIAVAVLGAQLLHAAAVVDLTTSLYRTATIPWGGHVLGGILFGFGMVLAGGCVSRNLVRAGAGDLRALLMLLVLSVTVAAALGGILGPLRISVLTATTTAAPGPASPQLVLGTAAAVALALATFSLSDANFRASPAHVAAGLVVGLCVVVGWALTGLAHDPFADTPVPAQSLTFVKPVADTVDWLERFTALGAPSFAIASVVGTIVGAFLSALVTRTFRLTSFADTRDTARNLIGAALMAIGGVLALGCSIGQGVTGLSTLSVGSLLAAASIVCGAVIGLKASERYSILT